MAETESVIIGRILGRYQLLQSVARGGMGQVWLGRLHGARGFHKLVAIKTILEGSSETGRFESMLLEEARIAALIHHPNVVQTIELGEDKGTLFLVMEWVDGEPLSSVLTLAEKRGGLPLGVAANLIAQTLRGLHAAHELCDNNGSPLGVVHRDVSPHNVLITYSGAAKLLDFGIAKATKGTSAQTVTGEVKGKFAYMAPEQVLGGTINRRTDLFAAGIMLYTMTAGRHPFKHHNDAGVLHAITSEKPAEAPSRFVPDYPPALEAVVMKAIDKEVEKRFATADEMRVALEQAIPRALTASDARVRSFIGDLLAERAAARREAVKRVLLRADSQTGSGGTGSGPIFVQSLQSASSLRAVEVDGRSTASGPVVASIEHTVRRLDSKLPLRRSRRRYQAALLAAVAVAAVALVIAAKALLIVPRPVSSPVPAAPAVAAEPLPVVVPPAPVPAPEDPVAPAAPDGGANAIEPSATDPSEKPADRARAQRNALKAKRGAKSAEADDLIAPDYAQ